MKLIVEVTEDQARALRMFLNNAETGLRNQAGAQLGQAKSPERQQSMTQVVIALGAVSRAVMDALDHAATVRRAGPLKP